MTVARRPLPKRIVRPNASAEDLGRDLVSFSTETINYLRGLGLEVDALEADTGPRPPSAHHTTHEAGGSDAIKLDNLDTPDDNTDLNANTTAHGLLPKLSGTTTSWLRGDGSWSTPTAGVTSIWHPDVPTAALNAANDEFTGASLDPKWHIWNPAGRITPGVASGSLYLEETTSASTQFEGIDQAVPGSEFAVYTKVSANSLSPNLTTGLMIAGDIVTSPTTAGLELLEMNMASPTAGNPAVGSASYIADVRARKWTNYTTFSAGHGAWNVGGNAVYMRARVNGTTVAYDVSTDGRSWMQLTTFTAAFTPTRMGLHILNANSGVTLRSQFEFFRVFSGAGTSGFYATSIGGTVGGSSGYSSERWAKPAVAHASNEEFDTSSLTNFTLYDSTGVAIGGQPVNNTIDPYANDTTNTHADANSYRPDWLTLKIRNNNTVHYYVKPYVPATNVHVWSRLGTRSRSSGATEETDFALVLMAATGGHPDPNNMIYIGWGNSSGSRVLLFRKKVAGVQTDILIGGAMNNDTTPPAYLSLHKLGTTWHGYLHMDSSHQSYLASSSFTPTIAYVGFWGVTNSSTPGNGLVQADFLRFVDSATYLP